MKYSVEAAKCQWFDVDLGLSDKWLMELDIAAELRWRTVNAAET
jgi:hypothetical protein